jgi:hypothetical protein
MTESPERLPLRRRLFRRRVEAALTDRGSGLALGAVIVVTAAAYVLGVRGVLAPTAWQAGLVAGGAFVLLRSALRLFGGREDPALLREVLTTHFGEEIRNDPDVSRLSRQAIEQRLQLSDALASAPSALARAGEALLPPLDLRLDQIASEARAAALRRAGARFQAGMAQLANQRLTEVSRIAKTSSDEKAEAARKAADWLSAQVEASGGVVSHAEDRLLALDHAVADFGTVVARALLALSKQDRATLDSLARNASSAAPG